MPQSACSQFKSALYGRIHRRAKNGSVAHLDGHHEDKDNEGGDAGPPQLQVQHAHGACTNKKLETLRPRHMSACSWFKQAYADFMQTTWNASPVRSTATVGLHVLRSRVHRTDGTWRLVSRHAQHLGRNQDIRAKLPAAAQMSRLCSTDAGHWQHKMHTSAMISTGRKEKLQFC